MVISRDAGPLLSVVILAIMICGLAAAISLDSFPSGSRSISISLSSDEAYPLAFGDQESEESEGDSMILLVIIIFLGGAAIIYGLIHYRPEAFGIAPSTKVSTNQQQVRPEQEPIPPEVYSHPITKRDPYAPTQYPPTMVHSTGMGNPMSSFSTFQAARAPPPPQVSSSVSRPGYGPTRQAGSPPAPPVLRRASSKNTTPGSAWLDKIGSGSTPSEEPSGSFRPGSGTASGSSHEFTNAIVPDPAFSSPRRNQQRVSVPPPPAPTTWKCPVCLRSWGMNKTYCWQCGTPRR